LTHRDAAVGLYKGRCRYTAERWPFRWPLASAACGYNNGERGRAAGGVGGASSKCSWWWWCCCCQSCCRRRRRRLLRHRRRSADSEAASDPRDDQQQEREQQNGVLDGPQRQRQPTAENRVAEPKTASSGYCAAAAPPERAEDAEKLLSDSSADRAPSPRFAAPELLVERTIDRRSFFDEQQPTPQPVPQAAHSTTAAKQQQLHDIEEEEDDRDGDDDDDDDGEPDDDEQQPLTAASAASSIAKSSCAPLAYSPAQNSAAVCAASSRPGSADRKRGKNLRAKSVTSATGSETCGTAGSGHSGGASTNQVVATSAAAAAAAAAAATVAAKMQAEQGSIGDLQKYHKFLRNRRHTLANVR